MPFFTNCWVTLIAFLSWVEDVSVISNTKCPFHDQLPRAYKMCMCDLDCAAQTVPLNSNSVLVQNTARESLAEFPVMWPPGQQTPWVDMVEVVSRRGPSKLAFWPPLRSRVISQPNCFQNFLQSTIQGSVRFLKTHVVYTPSWNKAGYSVQKGPHFAPHPVQAVLVWTANDQEKRKHWVVREQNYQNAETNSGRGTKFLQALQFWCWSPPPPR